MVIKTLCQIQCILLTDLSLEAVLQMLASLAVMICLICDQLSPSERSYWDGDDQSAEQSESGSDSPCFDWDGFSQDRDPSFDL